MWLVFDKESVKQLANSLRYVTPNTLMWKSSLRRHFISVTMKPVGRRQLRAFSSVTGYFLISGIHNKSQDNINVIVGEPFHNLIAFLEI